MPSKTKADLLKEIASQQGYIDELQQRTDEHGVTIKSRDHTITRRDAKIERLADAIVVQRVAYSELRGYMNSMLDDRLAPVVPKPGCSQCGHGAVYESMPPNFPKPPPDFDNEGHDEGKTNAVIPRQY